MQRALYSLIHRSSSRFTTTMGLHDHLIATANQAIAHSATNATQVRSTENANYTSQSRAMWLTRRPHLTLRCVLSARPTMNGRRHAYLSISISLYPSLYISLLQNKFTSRSACGASLNQWLGQGGCRTPCRAIGEPDTPYYRLCPCCLSKLDWLSGSETSSI